MRRITLLPSITLTHLDGTPRPGAPAVSMASFVLGILEDPKAVRTFAKLSSSLRVAQAFKGADPLGVLLDEQDWAHLCELVREPTEGYTSAAYALKAFCDAILDAPEGP